MKTNILADFQICISVPFSNVTVMPLAIFAVVTYDFEQVFACKETTYVTAGNPYKWWKCTYRSHSTFSNEM